MSVEQTQFGWKDPDSTCAHDYLLPGLVTSLKKIFGERQIRLLDLGCGNGFIASRITDLGHEVIGIDAAIDGINVARTAYPRVTFKRCSIYEDLWEDIDEESFDCVVSLEVVEHLLYPRALFEKANRLLKTDGHLIVSTPYHGYLKNLALSLTGGWDKHFDVSWDGGHVKFFSKKTIRLMASEAGFKNIRIFGVGRVPALWKSMILVAQK